MNYIIHIPSAMRLKQVITKCVSEKIIQTCKMCGVLTLEYFKQFFKAIMQGRTDYENMLPMTIGIKK